jgi:hypothetical protein
VDDEDSSETSFPSLIQLNDEVAESITLYQNANEVM